MKFLLPIVRSPIFETFPKFVVRKLSLKSFVFSFLIAAGLFFVPQKAAAQTPVGTFTDFIAITTTTPDFDVVLADNIFFTSGGFNIFSGTINGNGNTLDGNGNAGFKILGNSAGKDVSFTGDITFNNFLNSVGSSGQVAQGGGLFAGGTAAGAGYGTNTGSGGAATIIFTSSTVNFTNNSATSGGYGTAAQGGGFFAGGAISVGGTNISSGGITTITFNDSAVNFINNRSASGYYYGQVAQGGGLFAGGAISAGAINGNTNLSSGGITAITFTGSTLNFAGNSLASSNYGSASQGGGLFAGGAISAGTSGSSNYSGGGTAAITFTSSTVNFTSNSATSLYTAGTTAQGGGLFAGGAVSAGAHTAYGISSTNNSSDGAVTITFTGSTVNIAGNQVTLASGNTKAQGGGIFLGGSVSAGLSTSGGTGATNISAGGTATIDFTGSNISISGNTAGLGGGIFAAGSLATDTGAASDGNAVMNFTDSTINFTGNTARDSGGAIYMAGNFSTDSASATDGIAIINFASSTVSFTSNTAVTGGAIYAVNNSSITFDKDTAVEFLWNNSTNGNGVVQWDSTTYMGLQNANITRAIGNQANNGGFLYLDNQGIWDFGAVEMSSNTARSGSGNGNGGALYLSNTNVNFNDSAVFSGNQASVSGGAIYNTGALAQILAASGNNMIFTTNTAQTGGAIYNAGSVTLGNSVFAGNAAAIGGAVYNAGDISINSGLFSLNVTGQGGALYNDAGAVFASNAVSFTSNTTTLYGGAISNYGTVTIDSGSFTFNSGGLGGAIDNTGTLNLGNVLFSNNSVDVPGVMGQGNGGAIANRGGDINISENASFTSNTAAAYIPGGGAIYNSGGTITFLPQAAAVFTGNAVYSNAPDSSSYYTANGGAIYNTDGEITLWNASFVSNNAGTNGGAVYSDNGANTNFGGGIVNFEGNAAGNLGGAIYMTGSTVTFNTDGGEVLFRGNTAGGVPNDVYMDIDSQLNINGTNAISFEDGIVTERSGSGIVITKAGAGAMYLGGDSQVWGDFNISGNGDIIMMDSATYTGKALDLGSTSGLDMHNNTVNTVNVDNNFTSNTNLKMDIFSDGTNDQITAGTANIDGNLDIFAGVGTYKAKEYDLIITSGTDNLDGEFASSTMSRNDLQYSLVYESGTVKLIVTGLSLTNFGELKPLTYNQSETSKAFNKISKNPGQWAGILNEMVARQDSGTDADIAVIKDFLARTSGYFLANVIRNMAADSPNNEVYDKIRNHIEDRKTNSGLWVQLRGGLESFKKDENSLEDYNDTSYGVMFGFDRFLADKVAGGDVMWGVYGRINKDNIEQGNSKANGSKSGLGLYGGYLKDAWELKAMLLGEYDAVSTERADYVGDIAKADINGVTVSADLEAALKLWMTDNMNFRPYVGIEAANTSYGGFKESGGGMYDLDTQPGNYLRTAGRVGAGLDYEKGIWIWYANVEGKYIFDGTKPEITSQFADTGVDFYSRGAKEGHLQLGAGLGGEVRIAEDWKLFANGKYYVADRYENLYGNIGVRYLFGKKQNKAEEKATAARAAALEAQKKAEEAKLRAEAARLEQAKLEEERTKAEEAKRIAEEAKITTEISDADLAKQKVEAEERRKRPMLKTYTLTAHFKTNSYFLSEEDKEQIRKIAEELKNYDYKKITIEGHTDNTGTKELNKRLSRQRARSVYDEFAKAGISAEMMTYEGFADTMPVKSNSTAEGRAANRRTEIFVE